MKPIDNRPSSGSCHRCRAALGLASLFVPARSAEPSTASWYCSMGCAEGRPLIEGAQRSIRDEKLVAAPRRYFGRRSARELNR